MRIQIITPANPFRVSGNQITANRWSRILRLLGHQVRVKHSLDNSPYDLIIGLHAWRNAKHILNAHGQYPEKPIIVCLTGTDLYRDIYYHSSAQRVLKLADRLIVLHPNGSANLPHSLRKKTRVILQSLEGKKRMANPPKKGFDVCVVANLRPEKDPFRAAMASRLLSKSSKLRVIHLGDCSNEKMLARAQAEMKRNLRYKWIGPKSWGQTLREISRHRALVITSKLEGGANVVSEAIVESVPVISSDNSGSIGILGKNYPGIFPQGETRTLAKLLNRLENEPGFHERLQAICQSIAPMFDPQLEIESWENLLREMGLS